MDENFKAFDILGNDGVVEVFGDFGTLRGDAVFATFDGGEGLADFDQHMRFAFAEKFVAEGDREHLGAIGLGRQVIGVGAWLERLVRRGDFALGKDPQQGRANLEQVDGVTGRPGRAQGVVQVDGKSAHVSGKGIALHLGFVHHAIEAFVAGATAQEENQRYVPPTDVIAEGDDRAIRWKFLQVIESPNQNALKAAAQFEPEIGMERPFQPRVFFRRDHSNYRTPLPRLSKYEVLDDL